MDPRLLLSLLRGFGARRGHDRRDLRFQLGLGGGDAGAGVLLGLEARLLARVRDSLLVLLPESGELLFERVPQLRLQIVQGHLPVIIPRLTPDGAADRPARRADGGRHSLQDVVE